MTNIKYAGKDFRQDLGLYVDSIESYDTPKKSYTFHEVLGRNGSLAVDDHRFEDHEETFNCYIRQDFVPNFRNVQAFLNSLKGYQRLERSNEPDYFEMGLYEGEISPRPTQLLQAGAFPFRLRLHPEKWLKSGETAVDAASTSETLEGNPIQFENPSGLTALTGLNVDIEPVQSGEGDPSPTNIRPITGHTQAVVARTGKNLAPLEAIGAINLTTGELQTASSSTYARTGYVVCEPNTAYTVSADWNLIQCIVGYYNQNGYVSYSVINPSGGSAKSITFTTLSNITKMVVVIRRTEGTSNLADFTNVMIEKGSTATEYESYTGQTVTVDLNGTRYGGTLDVLTWVLTVDRVMFSMNGDSPVALFGDAGIRYPSILTESMNWGAVLSSHGTSDKSKGTAVLNMRAGGGNKDFYWYNILPTLGITTLAQFKTWLTNNPVTVVYKLTTPTTVQLTAQQVSLLTGTNIISTDMNSLTVTLSNPAELENPTLFESKPLIRIYGTGTVNINNDYITIDSASPFTFIDLDCETMNASSAGENANQYIEILNDAEITLKPGTNYVAYSGNITTVEITPRWYTI